MKVIIVWIVGGVQVFRGILRFFFIFSLPLEYVCRDFSIFV